VKDIHLQLSQNDTTYLLFSNSLLFRQENHKAQPVLESKIRAGIKTIITVRESDISDVLFVFTLNLSQLTVNYAEI
jgi:hypothetical protein